MFTGLIEEMGTVENIRIENEKAVLSIGAKTVLDDLAIGDSVAVNGACLTVVALTGRGFQADATLETLGRTTLGELRPGDSVNLERALQVGDRLGGHFVMGHVDGVGRISARRAQGGSQWVEVQAPAEMLRYIVEKGSVTVDGVSLTVAAVQEDRFAVALIPHSGSVTTLGDRNVGTRVNLEVDVIGKYVERFLAGRLSKKETLNQAFLQRHGFA